MADSERRGTNDGARADYNRNDDRQSADNRRSARDNVGVLVHLNIRNERLLGAARRDGAL